MKRFAMTAVAVTAVALVGLNGVHAGAQGMMGGSYGYGMGPGMMGGYGGGQGWGQMMGAYDQGWFDALKEKLAITPAQQKAWDSYVAAAKDNAQSMIDTHKGMDFDALRKMDSKDQIAFMRGMHEARIDQMSKVLDARDNLFKVLDDKQKKVAEIALGGYGMGMGYGMGPGMMGGGWQGKPSGGK